jgi:hypothetical protein
VSAISGDRILIALWGRSTPAVAARLRYDEVLARLGGSADKVAHRTTVVVPLPKFERCRTIHGTWVELHEFVVGGISCREPADQRFDPRLDPPLDSSRGNSENRCETME